MWMVPYHISTSSLTVPFSTHKEADNARHFLTGRTQLQGPVRKELCINGSMLVMSILKGPSARAGVVGGDLPRLRRSHNGGLSLEKCGALGLLVCRDRGRTCSSSSFSVETGISFSLTFTRLSAEDHALLQMYIAFCLVQISLVMRSLLLFVPLVFAKLQHGRKG